MRLAYHHNTMYDFGLPKHDPVVAPEDRDAMMSSMKEADWRLSEEGKCTEFVKFTEEELRKWKRETAIPSEGPAWLKHDKQVCRFFAYTQDVVTESNVENSRTRYCTIMYFLEDGTMQVDEHKTANSGLWQGSMVKRHCILNADESGYMGLDDLKCGQNITMYARTYHIVGCDAFTRWYYAQNGIEAGEEEDVPKDAYTTLKDKLQAKHEGPAPKEVVEGKKYNDKAVGGNRGTNDKLEQFMENDLRVLRFYCYWDDHTTYGARTYYEFSYFLADNQGQIVEREIPNSGKGTMGKTFFAKGPMKKKLTMKILPGMLEPELDVYLPTDFVCGGAFTMYNREFVIYDVDPFTREFYKKWLGIDQVKQEIPPVPVREVKMPIPPHVGVGDEDDSIGSCLALWPKPRKVDQKKLMLKAGMVLRFEAKFLTPQYPEDVDRKFVLAFSLQDDELAVYEQKRRNSGFMEGKFAEKSKKRNPDNHVYYAASDFWVGNVIKAHGAAFKVLRPDEYTLAYMEATPEDFPYSDVSKILPKLGELEAKKYSPDDLMATGKFVDQEVITLLRKFGSEGAMEIDTAAILGA